MIRRPRSTQLNLRSRCNLRVCCLCRHRPPAFITVCRPTEEIEPGEGKKCAKANVKQFFVPSAAAQRKKAFRVFRPGHYSALGSSARGERTSRQQQEPADCERKTRHRAERRRSQARSGEEKIGYTFAQIEIHLCVWVHVKLMRFT